MDNTEELKDNLPAKTESTELGEKTLPKRIIGKPFTSENQPTAEQKSRGWERRNKWLDEIDEIMEQIIELKDPFTKNDEKLKLIKHLQRRYIAALLSMRPQIFIDWLNRKYGVPKIPLEHDIGPNLKKSLAEVMLDAIKEQGIEQQNAEEKE